ncbi:hypothetical protein B0A53_05147 [Rhodotorula sp. CCFEE 5036]|nr:hypothetical protein B0A53_05147 [Rhodotorula sp. CCFEE 5036]
MATPDDDRADGARQPWNSPLYRVELGYIDELLRDVRDGEGEEVAEAVETVIDELRDKDDPGSFLNGQPTFEAMLHLVAALGLWRLDDLTASAEHLRRVHAMATSNTNPRYRRRYEGLMRRATNIAGFPDYPALEEFPRDENSPLWDYPPQVVIDEDGETRLIPPERVLSDIIIPAPPLPSSSETRDKSNDDGAVVGTDRGQGGPGSRSEAATVAEGQSQAGEDKDQVEAGQNEGK